jgi:hypothetical protein
VALEVINIVTRSATLNVSVALVRPPSGGWPHEILFVAVLIGR